MSWPKGKPRSEETKRKISAWGQANNAFRGKHHTEENKKKASQRMTILLKGNKRRLGILHTEETKKRISATSKANWQKNGFRRKAREWWAQLSDEEKKTRMQATRKAIKRFSTSIERAIEEMLDSLGVQYESQKHIDQYIVDIFIPSKGLIVECDGDYWHSLPRVLKRDKERDKYLRGLGYQIVRIPEHKIKRGLIGIQSSIFCEIAEG